jgi:hypothetical protein
MRTRFEVVQDKKFAVLDAENKGLIADSTEYRKRLMERASNGEITLEEAKAYLVKTKRLSKNNGLMTRKNVYSRG